MYLAASTDGIDLTPPAADLEAYPAGLDRFLFDRFGGRRCVGTLGGFASGGDARPVFVLGSFCSGWSWWRLVSVRELRHVLSTAPLLHIHSHLHPFTPSHPRTFTPPLLLHHLTTSPPHLALNRMRVRRMAWSGGRNPVPLDSPWDGRRHW